ncbi:hypothetical protein [Streptomyces sp. NPDC020298]|uniref:hypothetical protein n=1 Tax=unclassified Streptomyces TaxID=2593676 RepID=UPI0033CA5960
MTTNPAARRFLVWTAPPAGFGILAMAAKDCVGIPGWAVALSTAAGVVVSALPALLPQESEHRRDAWRDWLRHRERMARLRITTADLQPGTARLRNDHQEQSGRPRELSEACPSWRRRTSTMTRPASLRKNRLKHDGVAGQMQGPPEQR